MQCSGLGDNLVVISNVFLRKFSMRLDKAVYLGYRVSWLADDNVTYIKLIILGVTDRMWSIMTKTGLTLPGGILQS